MALELTDKQEKYCQAYVRLNDKSAAYREAYDADAMNSNTVNVKACELHKVGNVTVRIDELQAEIRERNKINIDDVLSVLTDMIKFDISEIYDNQDRLKSIHDIPKQHRQMITSLKTYEEYSGSGMTKELIGYTKEVKTLNKLDVIEKFMKHLGGYEKDNTQKQLLMVEKPITPEQAKKVLDDLDSK